MSDQLPETDYCTRHGSLISNAGEVCQAKINIAYRVGGNPFDSWNNRQLGKCTFISVQLVVAAIGDGDE